MAADDSPCLAALVGKAGAASDCWSLERSGAGWGGEASLPEQAGAAAQEEQLPPASLWSQVGEGQRPHRLSYGLRARGGAQLPAAASWAL